MPGTAKLCKVLYGRPPRPRDYLGGSDSRMLSDAADEIERLRESERLSREMLARQTDLAREAETRAMEVTQQNKLDAETVDKAMRFDLDAAGIERREMEAVELVNLRARWQEQQVEIQRLKKGLVYASEFLLEHEMCDHECADLAQFLAAYADEVARISDEK